MEHLIQLHALRNRQFWISFLFDVLVFTQFKIVFEYKIRMKHPVELDIDFPTDFLSHIVRWTALEFMWIEIIVKHTTFTLFRNYDYYLTRVICNLIKSTIWILRYLTILPIRNE